MKTPSISFAAGFSPYGRSEPSHGQSPVHWRYYLDQSSGPNSIFLLMPNLGEIFIGHYLLSECGESEQPPCKDTYLPGVGAIFNFVAFVSAVERDVRTVPFCIEMFGQHVWVNPIHVPLDDQCEYAIVYRRHTME